MKKLILMALFLSAGICCAQPYNAIYGLVQPANLGTGLRADFNVVGTPVYSSFSYGSWGNYKRIGFTNIKKLTIGTLIPLNYCKGDYYQINAGASYYWYDYTEKFYNIQSVMFWHWSVEVGLTVYYKLPRYRFPKWLAMSITTDIPKWFPIVAFGVVF